MAKTCVITDIHGRLDDLLALLIKVPQNAQLVFLGDYVDRGTQSAEVVAHVRSLQAKGAICLRGNHEDMMLNPGDTWFANGGMATMASYADPLTGVPNAGMMEEDAKWMESLPCIHEDRHRVYVHAGVDPRYALSDQIESITQWYRYPKGADEGYRGKHVVHGHTPGVLTLTRRTCLDAGMKAMVCGVFDDDLPGGPVELIWR